MRVQRGGPLGVLLCLVVFCLFPNGLIRVGPEDGTVLAKTGNIYYESTIKGIILADCGRCHSGPTRNLTDYDSLRAYADSGLLETMVQGPMRRFAGNDAETIVTWIRDGAPEKPGAAAAAWFSRQGAGNNPACPTPPASQANGQITYDNTIKGVLAVRCMRCHSGPFRNLATYKNLKMYVDNGLLETLVLPGGPMHRFAGPDTRLIMAWIKNGAPQ